jgi:hypothetical protein
MPEWAKKKWGNETTFDKLRSVGEWGTELEFNQPGEARYKGGEW